MRVSALERRSTHAVLGAGLLGRLQRARSRPHSREVPHHQGRPRPEPSSARSRTGVHMDSSALRADADDRRPVGKLYHFCRHSHLLAVVVALQLIPSERAVLEFLLKVADKHGRSWFTPRAIAREIGRTGGKVYSAKQIRRALNRLHELELLRWDRIMPLGCFPSPEDPAEAKPGTFTGVFTEHGGRAYYVNLAELRKLRRESKPASSARPRAPAQTGGGRGDIGVPGRGDMHVPSLDPSRSSSSRLKTGSAPAPAGAPAPRTPPAFQAAGETPGARATSARDRAGLRPANVASQTPGPQRIGELAFVSSRGARGPEVVDLGEAYARRRSAGPPDTPPPSAPNEGEHAPGQLVAMPAELLERALRATGRP